MRSKAKRVGEKKCKHIFKILKLCIYLFYYYYYFFMATPVAYGSSQASGWIGAAAAGLCHSHGNTISELHL